MSEERASGVPGAFRRFGRDRGRIAVTAALAAAGLLAGILPGGFGAVLHADGPVERGPYDLLVTAAPAPDEAHAAGADGTPAGNAETSDPFPDGLVPPGLITEHRLSLDDLDTIRTIEGVDVAAPYGLLFTPIWPPAQAEFVTDLDTSTTTPAPQAYRAEMRSYGDDGTGERLLDEQTIRFSLDRADVPGRVLTAEELGPGWTCGVEIDGTVEMLTADDPRSLDCRTEPYSRFIAETDSGGTAGSWSEMSLPSMDGRLFIDFGGIPQRGQWMAVVDPFAESELLGDDRPLEPMRSFAGVEDADDILAWADEHPGPGADELRGFVEAITAQGPDAVEEHLPRLIASMGPVVLLDTRGARLRQEIVLSSLGPTPVTGTGWPDMAELLSRDDPGEPVATVEFELGGRRGVFYETPTLQPWPAAPTTEAIPDTYPFGGFPTVTSLPRGPVAATPPHEGTSWTAAKLGKLPMLSGSYSVLDAPAPAAGSDATLLTPEYLTVDRAGGSGTGMGGIDTPTLVIVGEADAHELAVDAALGTSPRTLIADAAGDPIDPVELLPSYAGLGIGDGAPSLLTTFDTLGGMLPENPVHAVRVRVSGVDAYTPSGIRAVEETAARLEAAGFVVTPVAGSRPVERDIVVEGYAFGRGDDAVDAGRIRSVGLAEADADGIGRLGTVRETWTALGPAATAEPAPGAASAVAVWLGIGAALLALAAFELGAVRRRREEALVLRTLGWPGGRIGWWFGAPAVITFAVVLVVSQAALAVGGTWSSTPAQALAGGTLLIGAAALAATMRGPGRLADTALAASGAVRHPFAARIAGGALLVAGTAVAAVLVAHEASLAGSGFAAEAVADPRFLVPAGSAAVAAVIGAALLVGARHRAAGARD